MLSDKISLENGKILLELDSIQRNTKILKSNIEFQQKNINSEQNYNNKIRDIDENFKLISNFKNDNLSSLEYKLNEVLSNY